MPYGTKPRFHQALLAGRLAATFLTAGFFAVVDFAAAVLAVVAAAAGRLAATFFTAGVFVAGVLAGVLAAVF